MTPPHFTHDPRDELGRFRDWFVGLSLARRVLIVIAGLAAMYAFARALVFSLPLLLAGIVVLLALAWFKNFTWLMRQPDSVFPGRYDKLIWAALLTLLPPVGMFALWSFRRSMGMRAGATKSESFGGRDWM